MRIVIKLIMLIAIGFYFTGCDSSNDDDDELVLAKCLVSELPIINFVDDFNLNGDCTGSIKTCTRWQGFVSYTYDLDFTYYADGNQLHFIINDERIDGTPVYCMQPKNTNCIFNELAIGKEMICVKVVL